jgi:uncharacterized protein (TIGR02145 family)
MKTKMEGKKLKLIPLLTILLVLFISFFSECSKYEPDGVGCYGCSRETETPIGVTIETKQICGKDEIESEMRKGWHCLGYKRPPADPVPGARRLGLLHPGFQAKFVLLNDTLKWNNNINWWDYDSEILPGLTYDVYFETKTPPQIIISKNQTNTFFIPELDYNTKYYWKVIAKNNQGDEAVSNVYEFTTILKIADGTFTDPRDGRLYKTFSIGEQTWMSENLAYEIPGKQASFDSLWYPSIYMLRVPDAWCYYNNDKDSLGRIYGVLYQWKAAQEACPTGWHLPSIEDWNIFKDYLGNIDKVGNNMREIGISHWSSPNANATNLSHFTALPGGLRTTKGVFKSLGIFGVWWSNTEYGYDDADIFGVGLDSYSTQGNAPKRNGYSVRCVKD